jgi:hypothetical protein
VTFNVTSHRQVLQQFLVHVHSEIILTESQVKQIATAGIEEESEMVEKLCNLGKG